jgi:hypothetical protein
MWTHVEFEFSLGIGADADASRTPPEAFFVVYADGIWFLFDHYGFPTDKLN